MNKKIAAIIVLSIFMLAGVAGITVTGQKASVTKIEKEGEGIVSGLSYNSPPMLHGTSPNQDREITFNEDRDPKLSFMMSAYDMDKRYTDDPDSYLIRCTIKIKHPNGDWEEIATTGDDYQRGTFSDPLVLEKNNYVFPKAAGHYTVRFKAEDRAGENIVRSYGIKITDMTGKSKSSGFVHIGLFSNLPILRLLLELVNLPMIS